MANNDNKSLLKHTRINIQRYIHLDLAAATAFYKSSYNPITEAITNHPLVRKITIIDVYSRAELLKKLDVADVLKQIIKNMGIHGIANIEGG
jgi:hypothetical protein